MPVFNDLKMDKWKETEIWTDSLWLINERDKSGKHSGHYHGNFVPQIPRQLILRYTKKDEIVFDPFFGSGTTAFEAERLERNFAGIEIQKELVELVDSKLDQEGYFSELICGDSTKSDSFENVKSALKKNKRETVQLVILHPPYSDIIKFSDLDGDLSNLETTEKFLEAFSLVIKQSICLLDKGRYLAIVIGDKYTSGEWVPLGFYCLNEAKKLGLTLKSVVVKNMAGNRAKQNKEGIWRYRALSSDYYIFKHEYILLFKN